MKVFHSGVLPNKLVDSVQQAGLLEREQMSFFPKEDGLEIKFRDIEERKKYAVDLQTGQITDEVISISYEKRIEHMTIIPATDDKPEKEETYWLWEDYTAEFEAFLAEIQAVVYAHDPLQGLRDDKISILSDICGQNIVSGFESSCLGEAKMFDSDVNSQANIQGLAITAILGLQGLTTEETHWKCTGEPKCYNFEYAQIIQLAADLKKHVETNINKKNDLRIQVNEATTKEELESIVW